METQYLKTLSVVVEGGSFSRAATELCITQSAVSQRIKFLEERYGQTLIDRSCASLCATEAGRLVIAAARQIIALENELDRQLKALGRNSRLSLGCTPTFGVLYLPKVLNRFFMAFSDEVDFKFALNTPAQSLRGLQANEFDLCILEHCGELSVQEAEVHPLPPDELVLISAPALGLPEGEVRLDELLQHRLIARREGCSSRSVLQENLARVGKSLDDFKGSIVYDDLHLTLQTVLAGQGVAFVSKQLVEEQLQKGELREHRVEGFRCLRSRTALVHQKHAADPLVKSFMEGVMALFQQ